MPTCESPEDLQAYIDFYLQLTAASPKRRYEMTGCYQPCHHYVSDKSENKILRDNNWWSQIDSQRSTTCSWS